jgi:hypothetical protein
MVRYLPKIIAIILFVFDFLTLFLSGALIFGLFEITWVRE